MSPPALTCESLLKRFGKKIAVDGINLTIEAGQCLGLLGPNGAGKTTTVEMLEGLQRPTSGRIELFGIAWGSGRDSELRKRIGVQLQHTQLADKLTVREVLQLFRSFCDYGYRVDELIELVALKEEQDQRYHQLSGGQKQRVALATALAGKPELLFLDEPTTGLDPRARQSLWDIVERFRTDGGTVLLTTHYMEEAQSLCDKIAIIDQGRLIAEDSPTGLIDSLGDVQFVEFESGEPPDSDALLALPMVQDISRKGALFRLRIERSLGALRAVLAELERQRMTPIGLSTHQATLDDVFLNLTGRKLDAVNTSFGGASED